VTEGIEVDKRNMTMPCLVTVAELRLRERNKLNKKINRMIPLKETEFELSRTSIEERRHSTA
jgi:hypothetical protein